MVPFSCRVKAKLFTLVYEAPQGPASPTSLGSSHAICPLGEPTPTTMSPTKFISILGFCMSCFLCTKYLCPRSSRGSSFSSFQSHLKCQLLREVFLVHIAFSRPSFPTHHSLSHYPILYPVWHSKFVYCPFLLTVNINFMRAGSVLSPTVTPGPCIHWALRKDLLNECLNMAQILEYPQDLRNVLETMTV